MKAIIEVDVPDHQIGQEASIYFKDTMMIKGIAQESSGTIHGSTYGGVSWGGTYKPQEPKMGCWIIYNYPGHECVYCSSCKEEYYEDDLYMGGSDFPNYCPNCGARMEGEDDDLQMDSPRG